VNFTDTHFILFNPFIAQEVHVRLESVNPNK
jgi:hypothetical protein